jgi:hypothetical protein
MFTLVRINVPPTVRDADSGVVTHVNPDYIWDYVTKNHSSWRNKDVRILYMTRRHIPSDTSLIVDSSDPDVLSDFILKHIATARHVRGIWIMNMAKMRFFQLPADRPRDFSRFTVTIDAKPSYLEKIYEEISSFEPGRDIMVNYIAHTFQSFTGSIMISVLAKGKGHMDTFVEDCIKSIDGVLNAEITHISKSIRLVSSEEWGESVGPFTVAPGGKRLKDIDPTDDTLMASC